MSYAITISHDGCHRGTVNGPMSHATYEAAVQAAGNWLPPRGYEFDIRDNETGRVVSWVTKPTVARRQRLELRHFSPH